MLTDEEFERAARVAEMLVVWDRHHRQEAGLDVETPEPLPEDHYKTQQQRDERDAQEQAAKLRAIEYIKIAPPNPYLQQMPWLAERRKSS